MKSEKNILIAFLLNLSFAIFEFIGGTLTNSVAIMSDAIHDIGDALSIGLSFIMENISKKKPNDKYTYGYIRYSVLGSLLTTMFLILGGIFVIINAIIRIKNPVEVNYQGMILFAIIGVIINFFAVFVTREGDSLNQKAVNLHMLEDVLGWIVVLVGSIIMNFTNIKIIDPLMSIGISIFILKNAFSNLIKIVDLFLEKTPNNIIIDEVKENVLKIKGVIDVHHIHIWSLDGINNYATMHVVIKKDDSKLKGKIKSLLKDMDIMHTTIEIEYEMESCIDNDCEIVITSKKHKHHH